MKKFYINGFIIILLLFLTRLDLQAITPAKYAGEFMSTGVGARALGMGGAHVAIGTDVTAGYWNPAGLIGVKFPQLVLMHSSRFNGIVKYDYGAIALPFQNHQALAISLIRLGVDDIPVTSLANPDLPLGGDNRPYIAKMVSDAEYAFYFSYARAVVGQFSYGVNLKLVHKAVGDNSAWGLGFDIGILMNPWSDLLFGINLQDATTTLVAWDTRRNELITPTLKFGIAYPLWIKLLSSKLVPVIDLDLRFENRRAAAQGNLGPISFDSHLGLEYNFLQSVALRVGSDTGFFTVGAGLKLPQLQIDYAFMKHDLGNTHRISVRISIEKEKFRQK
ncbi:PorV/PorQ family protein [candidate division KSB1 bacterium]|nr:PorV/PorQ family protein [candidate division KSB1 bacterium]